MHFLNTEILFEDMQKSGFPVRLHRSGSAARLSGYRFYFSGETTEDYLLYICTQEDAPDVCPGTALYIGSWDEKALPADSDWLLCRDADKKRLVNYLESLFSSCRATENAVELALASAESLDRICSAAADYFGVFCFVHDAQFCLIGFDRRLDPAHIPDFEYSEQYGCYMQASSILNDFRTNPEYRRTLLTTGCCLWIDPSSDERCLYMNLFLSDQYQGRFLVTLKELTPGRKAAVEYFGNAFLEAMAASPLADIHSGNILTRMLKRYTEGEALTDRTFTAIERTTGWPLQGSYVCCLIGLYENQLNNYMLRSVCSKILERIPGSSLYYTRTRIYILINLQIAKIHTSDIRMKMSELIRESLLKAAVSDEFEKMRDFPLYMRQAAACLDHMEQTQMTDWFGEFRQIAVPYWLRNGTKELPPSLLVSRGIRLLKEYDDLNHSDLTETLKVYITQERNTTVTSQMLRIHRSTLPHRLEKIREITGLNPDHLPVRIHLLMSFAWLDEALTRH